MGKCSSDFERFLAANYPDDFRRVTGENVPDDVINAILSRHETHYRIWKNIPEWVKDKYRDIIPSEVLNGNQTSKEFVLQEEEKKRQNEKDTQKLTDYSVTLLALGYSAETAAVLAANRQERAAILAMAGGAPLTGELRERWLALREIDCAAIRKDWKENQPEKYMLHLIKSLDRERRRGGKSASARDVAASAMKKGDMEKELTELVKMLSNGKNKERMAEYLRQKPQQAALRHLSPETLQRFTKMLGKQGIVLEADGRKSMVNVRGGRNTAERGRLATSLKNSFERCKKFEIFLGEKYRSLNKFFSRVVSRTATHQKKSVAARLNAIQKISEKDDRNI